MSQEERKEKKLSYDEIENLETSAKKLSGHKVEKWVDTKSICSTCKWATIIRRGSGNSRRIKCADVSEWVPEDLIECSSYQNITQLSLSQMASIAVIIDPRPDKYKGYL